MDQNFVLIKFDVTLQMLLIIQLLFMLCWLPYHLYFLATFWRPDIIYWPQAQTIFLLSYWLAMANSAINPIVYFTMSSK